MKGLIESSYLHVAGVSLKVSEVVYFRSGCWCGSDAREVIKTIIHNSWQPVNKLVVNKNVIFFKLIWYHRITPHPTDWVLIKHILSTLRHACLTLIGLNQLTAGLLAYESLVNQETISLDFVIFFPLALGPRNLPARRLWAFPFFARLSSIFSWWKQRCSLYSSILARCTGLSSRDYRRLTSRGSFDEHAVPQITRALFLHCNICYLIFITRNIFAWHVKRVSRPWLPSDRFLRPSTKVFA